MFCIIGILKLIFFLFKSLVYLYNLKPDLLTFRDARSHDKYQIGIVTKDSVEVQDLTLKPRWEVAKLVQGYE